MAIFKKYVFHYLAGGKIKNKNKQTGPHCFGTRNQWSLSRLPGPEGAQFAIPAQLSQGSALSYPGKFYPLLQATSCAVPGEKLLGFAFTASTAQPFTAHPRCSDGNFCQPFPVSLNWESSVARTSSAVPHWGLVLGLPEE